MMIQGVLNGTTADHEISAEVGAPDSWPSVQGLRIPGSPFLSFE